MRLLARATRFAGRGARAIGTSGVFAIAIGAAGLAAATPRNVARAETARDATELLNEAYRLKGEGRSNDAAEAFADAAAAGASAQLVAIELAYLAAARGDSGEARRRFTEALAGDDPKLAALARAEIDAMGKPAPPPPTPAA